ncbi:MAG: hypothetical protein U5K33_09470 [Halofilum sp. (in: g-proteobacteria)]|nr:hypothetical protein [Halofilum sp. (in: g-proteobacteria)]
MNQAIRPARLEPGGGRRAASRRPFVGEDHRQVVHQRAEPMILDMRGFPAQRPLEIFGERSHRALGLGPVQRGIIRGPDRLAHAQHHRGSQELAILERDADRHDHAVQRMVVARLGAQRDPGGAGAQFSDLGGGRVPAFGEDADAAAVLQQPVHLLEGLDIARGVIRRLAPPVDRDRAQVPEQSREDRPAEQLAAGEVMDRSRHLGPEQDRVEDG